MQADSEGQEDAAGCGGGVEQTQAERALAGKARAGKARDGKALDGKSHDGKALDEKVRGKRKPGATVCRVLICVVAFLAICFGGFLIYASDYYHADQTALAVLRDDATIEAYPGITVLPAEGSHTALIFYPGAKVEPEAYLPQLERIRADCDITCILVSMPFNMAIFDVNAADRVMEMFPDIDTWYVGGHSMGGAMASDYASHRQQKVAGLILLGAYVYGDYPPAKALTIYGSLNSDLEKDIDYTDNIVKIEGGNHAQFGNYGKQRGDKDATISSEEQQEIAAAAIRDFINR